jgi:long-chain acyl-CoA synthetase
VVGEVYYCPELNSVLEYLQEARPTLFVGVPRVWEKFHARLLSRFDDNPKRDTIMKALANNEKVVRAENEGRSVGLLDRVKAKVFDRLVFSKVREQLGLDEVVLSISSAAPINPDLLVFFTAIGVPVFELYGMSETTGPATANRPGANRIGTVGRALPGVEVKIADDGEVLMKGGIITGGYYKLPEASEETFGDDGWLYSGDLGKLDDGFLSIVGRKKEIIITAAGKNVAPAKLEGILKNHPLVAQACMVGDQRKYLTMILALDGEVAAEWAEDNGVEYTDLETLSKDPAVIADIQRAVDEANAGVASVEQIKRFYVAPDEWTPESDEITPSLKLKRRVVLEKYGSDIEGMYAGA